MNEFFKLEEKQTSIKTEFIAGLTTFLAMAYILFVNPNTLQDAGMSWQAVFTATAIAAIVGTLIMGLLANYPVALAPGMGMNAFFTYTIVLGYGFTWKAALASIFCSGIVFMLISATGIREKIINAIPQDLKYAVGAGIGLFIAFIGFRNAGIIVNNSAIFVSLGKLGEPGPILAIIGLIVTVILYVKKVPAAIFISIVFTSVVGIVWRLIAKSAGLLNEVLDTTLPMLPGKVVDMPASPEFGAMFKGFGEIDFSNVSHILTFLLVVFSLLFIDFFDTAGTLVTVGSRCGLINKEGKLENSGKALMADATATVVGAVVGTSSTTSYIESLSGVEVGGRTGLTSVFTAMFFAIAIFFSPLLSVVTAAVTAPALIFVGILMAAQLGKIDWHDTVIAIPAFLTILMMPLTNSIATGIAVGFLFYPITMLTAKRHKEVNIIMYILSLVFLLYFIVTTIA